MRVLVYDLMFRFLSSDLAPESLLGVLHRINVLVCIWPAILRLSRQRSLSNLTVRALRYVLAASIRSMPLNVTEQRLQAEKMFNKIGSRSRWPPGVRSPAGALVTFLFNLRPQHEGITSDCLLF
jgi:hypothetical protein